MQRVRGRSLGARRGPDTGTCSSPGVQDRASHTGPGPHTVTEQGSGKAPWPDVGTLEPQSLTQTTWARTLPSVSGCPERACCRGTGLPQPGSRGGGEGAPPKEGTLGVGSPAPAPAWGPFPRGRGG